MIGAPSGTRRVPGSGDCAATMLAAKPGTAPSTRQAKPPCSSVPLANTYACLRTSGTTSGSGAAATGGVAAGVEVESVLVAAKPSVPVTRASPAAIAATRGKRPMTPAVMSRLSAGRGLNSTPLERELDDVLGIPVRRDEREDRSHARIRRRGRVLPAERDAGELLKPGHLLRIARRAKPEVEVRAGRAAGRADEPDPLAGGQGRSRDEPRVAVREVAVDPLEPVQRPQHEAG